ncbi:MAG TPA: histidine-type phosphatase [Bryobacteraceae bacterium]|nr:histidine-type phosphatase [Bryobacteraceae bacterium]
MNGRSAFRLARLVGMIRPTANAGAILALAALLAAWPVSAAGGSHAELKYALIVSRHGVRSPTWDAARLNEYSAQPWPEWGVAPGEITARGRAGVKLMGAYYRDSFSKAGLLHTDGCRDVARIYIRADSGQRTRETGRAFAGSLLPGCQIPVATQQSGKDPLFSGVGKPDPELAAKAVRERLGPAAAVLAKYQPEFDALTWILTGGKSAHRTVMSAAPDEGGDSGAAGIPRPLATASTLSEVFLLEYAEGLPPSALGWGRLTKEKLLQILELHTAYADVARRTPYLARARGSNLLAHILASLEQAMSGKPVTGALGQPDDALAILAGHDTNLSNLSGMLDLSWRIPGHAPDDTPPESALIFSLWRDGAEGNWFVKLEFVTPSLDQMRHLDPLTLASPPARVPVTVPSCTAPRPDGGCTWPSFRAAMQKAIDPKFTDMR